jgi:hypothetical protein
MHRWHLPSSRVGFPMLSDQSRATMCRCTAEVSPTPPSRLRCEVSLAVQSPWCVSAVTCVRIRVRSARKPCFVVSGVVVPAAPSGAHSGVLRLRNRTTLIPSACFFRRALPYHVSRPALFRYDIIPPPSAFGPPYTFQSSQGIPVGSGGPEPNNSHAILLQKNSSTPSRR